MLTIPLKVVSSTGSYCQQGEKVNHHYYHLVSLVATEDDAREYYEHHPELRSLKRYKNIVFDVFI